MPASVRGSHPASPGQAASPLSAESPELDAQGDAWVRRVVNRTLSAPSKMIGAPKDGPSFDFRRDVPPDCLRPRYTAAESADSEVRLAIAVPLAACFATNAAIFA